jgi:hypothetical protein
MKATHWCVETDPNTWDDEPKTTPTVVVEEWINYNEKDSAWEIWYDLRRDGSATVKVHGYIHTTEILDELSAFDGYTPGDPYWKQTGETVEVVVKLTFEVKQ